MFCFSIIHLHSPLMFCICSLSFLGLVILPFNLNLYPAFDIEFNSFLLGIQDRLVVLITVLFLSLITSNFIVILSNNVL